MVYIGMNRYENGKFYMITDIAFTKNISEAQLKV